MRISRADLLITTGALALLLAGCELNSWIADSMPPGGSPVDSAGGKEPVDRDTAAADTAVKDTLPDPVVKDTLPGPIVKDTVGSDTTAKDTIPGPVVKDTVPPDPVVKDTVPPGPVVKDTVPPGPVVKDTVPPGPVVKDTVPPGPVVKDSVSPAPGGDAPLTHAQLAARMGVPASSVFLNSNLEEQDQACWDNRSGGYSRAGCGLFKGIGSYPIALSVGGPAHSGRKAIRITYAVNEEAGGSNVGVYSDTINVRAYYWFDPGFDFGQGMKIGRVSSFNSSTQVNDVDVILQCRSVNGANQCGVTDMHELGLHYNGRPLGSDWGAVSGRVSFQRGRWYAVEYQVIMNSPGQSNGIGRMWVDGVLVGERTNLRVRGSFGSEVKLNTVKVGGWYSNGGGGNSCANPSQPSRIYMDDVAIAKGYIGP